MQHEFIHDAVTRRGLLEGIGASVLVPLTGVAKAETTGSADWIYINGKVSTFDATRPAATAIAIRGEIILAVGTDSEILQLKGPNTRVVDLGQRRVIPGLIDSHMHFVRGSLSYNLDVRWDGVPSLKIALQLLKEQAGRTPPGQWVRVGGGWSEFQFEERRPPTIAELNAAAPETPVFVLYFYDMAFINRVGMKVLGIDARTKPLPGGLIQKGADGEPTGILIAHPFPATITEPLLRMPPLHPADASNSVRQFMLELNRLGVTSVVDPGGIGQPFPAMYKTLESLAAAKLLTVRVAMYLLPQDSGHELDDLRTYMKAVKIGGDDRWFRYVGGGEILVQSAMDWDLYTTPPVCTPDSVVGSLSGCIKALVEQGWSFREHAMFDHTISQYLDAIEAVNTTTPVSGVRWAVDHAELVSMRSLERIARLGGGIAIQHRAAFHGELGAKAFGSKGLMSARSTRPLWCDSPGSRAVIGADCCGSPGDLTSGPPIRKMLDLGIRVGAGTDATRDTTYNPWVCIEWLVTGKTVGGMQITPHDQCVDVSTALSLYTQGSAWFSGEEVVKGTLAPGRFADFAALSQDVLTVPADRLSKTQSDLTVVGGRPVHGTGVFASIALARLVVTPSWSPEAGRQAGYYQG